MSTRVNIAGELHDIEVGIFNEMYLNDTSIKARFVAYGGEFVKMLEFGRNEFTENFAVALSHLGILTRLDGGEVEFYSATWPKEIDTIKVSTYLTQQDDEKFAVNEISIIPESFEMILKHEGIHKPLESKQNYVSDFRTYTIVDLMPTSGDILITAQDGNVNIQTTVFKSCFCSGFSDMLIKLGMFKDGRVDNSSAFPSELRGKLRIEITSLLNSRRNGQIEVVSVDLSSESEEVLAKYTNKLSNIKEKYIKSDNVVFDDYIDNSSYENGKYIHGPYMEGYVVRVKDGDTIRFQPQIVENFSRDSNQEGYNDVTGLQTVTSKAKTWYVNEPPKVKNEFGEDTDKYQEIDVRLLGINTPEKVDEDDEDSKDKSNARWAEENEITLEEANEIGKISLNTLKNLLGDSVNKKRVKILIETYDDGKGAGMDTYGRYLGIIHIEIPDAFGNVRDINVNKTMLARGLAEPYYMTGSSGIVKSDNEIQYWWSYSPYRSHIKTDAERDADERAEEYRRRGTYSDMAGLSTSPTQNRRVDTLYGYKPLPGESLLDIANRYNTTINELILWNPDLKKIQDHGDASELEDIKSIDITVYEDEDDYYNIEVIPKGVSDSAGLSTDPETHYNDNVLRPNDEFQNHIELPPTDTPYHLRIGDCQFVIPPLSINVVSTVQNVGFKPLRSRTSIQTQSGYLNKIIEIQLFFHSLESINGYEYDSPDPRAKDKHYYLDGLRPLLALFKKTPFASIDNELINQVHGVYSVGLQSIKMETVPDFPDTISATLQLIPFNHMPYMPSFETFDEGINWPIYRWFYQQAMQPKEGRTHLAKVTNVSQEIKFSLLDEDVLATRMGYIRSLRYMAMPHEYATANGPSEDTEQGKEVKDAETLRLGEKQYRRYKNSKFAKMSDQVTMDTYIRTLAVPDPDLNVDAYVTEELKSIVYGLDEPKVYVPPFLLKKFYTFEQHGDYPSYDMSVIYNRNNYVIDPSSVSVTSLLSDKGRFDPSFKILSAPYNPAHENFGMSTDRFFISVEDKTTMNEVYASTALAEQDIEEYEKKYREIEELANAVEDSLNMVEFPIEDLTIINMQTYYENTFAALQISSEQQPTLQHIGGGDISFSINAQTTNRETVQRLNMLLAASQRLAREYRIAIVSGFLGFDCAYAKMLGIDSVLFDSLNISTVPNFPDLFNISMNLIGFNKQQKRAELINRNEGVDLEDIEDKNDLPEQKLDSKGYENLILESKLKQMELYPDLELPTYSEVNMMLSTLDLGELPNPYKAKFVDPDFYMMYEETYKDTLVNYYNTFSEKTERIAYEDSAGFKITMDIPNKANSNLKINADSNTINMLKEYANIVDEQEVRNTVKRNTAKLAQSDGYNKNLTRMLYTSFDGKDKEFVKSLFEPILEHIAGLGFIPSVIIAMALENTENGDDCYNFNLYSILATDDYLANWDGKYFQIGSYTVRSYTRDGEELIEEKTTPYRKCIYNFLEILKESPLFVSLRNAKDIKQAMQALTDSQYYLGKEAGTRIENVRKIASEPEYVALNSTAAKIQENNEKSIAEIYFKYSDFGETFVLAEGVTFPTTYPYSIKTSEENSDKELMSELGYTGNALAITLAKVEDEDELLEKLANIKYEVDLAEKEIGKKELVLKVCYEITGVSTVDGETVISGRVTYRGRFDNRYPMKTRYKKGPSLQVSMYNSIKGMMNDMIEGEKRGRLLKAFPSFNLLLVDEGRWMSWYKMWDNFYGFSSIISIDVVKSRKMVADTCVITMSNIYNNLTQREVEGKYSDHEWKWYNLLNFGDSDAMTTAWDIFDGKPTRGVIEARKEKVNQLALKPGARLHLRMGYGSNAWALPIVFNGTITECDVQEQVTMIAQGDGIELAHKIPGKRPNDINDRKEPRDFICHAMTDYGGGWNTFWRTLKDGNKVDPTQNIMHITHFGQSGWLPPANHRVAQDISWGFRGFWNETFRTMFNPFRASQIEKEMAEENGINAMMSEVYGNPWDNFGEPGMNIYRAAGFESMSEYMFTQDTTQDGEFYEKGKKMDIRGKDIWYIMYAACNYTFFGNNNFQLVGDEPNISVYMYDRSLWDIMVAFSRCVEDYIVAVIPFELRSTVFFGRPHWGVAYRYDYAYVYDEDNNEIRPMVKKAQRKPFSQMHFYTSDTDIISNKIRASADNIYTNVIVTWSGQDNNNNPENQAGAVHADTDIYPEFQKTAIVNLDLKVDTEANAVSEIKASEYAGVNILKDFMKDMYDGDLVMLGDPSIKPHDIFLLKDDYVDMKGFLGTKQVTHHFSYETGFITTVRPDAMVEGYKRETSALLSSYTPILTSILSTWAVKRLTALAWQKFLPGPIGKLLTATSGTVVSTLIKWLIGSKDIANATGATKAAVDWLFAYISNGDYYGALAILKSPALNALPGFAKMSGAVNKIVGWCSGQVLKGGLVGKTLSTLGTLAKFGMKHVVSVAVYIIVYQATMNWLNAAAATLRKRQAIMLMPIEYHGQPFHAGINGTQGMVAGSDPSWLDKTAIHPIMQTLYGAVGIQPPNYDNSEYEIDWGSL